MSSSPCPPTPETELTVNGYCVHCRTRRAIRGAIQVCNRRGGKDLKGHCAVCGTGMYRLGGWDSVAAAARKATNAQLESTSPTEPTENS